MSLSFRITDLELLPHKSGLARNLICSLIPSADVVTPPSSPDGERDGEDGVSPIFKGSRIRIGSFSVGLRFHFVRFRPLKFLFVNRGRDEATKDNTDASRNGATAEVDKKDRIPSEENHPSSSKTADDLRAKPGDGAHGEVAPSRIMYAFFLAPHVSVELNSVRIETEKVYLAPVPPLNITLPKSIETEFAAPPPPLFSSLLPRPISFRKRRLPTFVTHQESGDQAVTRSQDSSSSLLTLDSANRDNVGGAWSGIPPPAALVPLAMYPRRRSGPDKAIYLPTYDQPAALENMARAEAAEADIITYHTDQWLLCAKRRTKKLAKWWAWKRVGADSVDDGTIPASDASAHVGQMDVNDDASSAAAQESKTYAETAPAVIMAAEIQNQDSLIFRSVLRFVLSSLTVRVIDLAISVTGADADAIQKARNESEPREANLTLALVPRNQCATTVISLRFFKATFCRFTFPAGCDSTFRFEGLSAHVLFPEDQESPVASAQASDPPPNCQERHQLIHPLDIVLETEGLLSLLIWSLRYDHKWDHRRLSVTLTTPELSVCLTPRALRTCLAHLDDYSDANSPFNEWEAWLSKRRLEGIELDDEERRVYRESFRFLKSRGKKKSGESNEREISSRMTLQASRLREGGPELDNSRKSSANINSMSFSREIITSLQGRMSCNEMMEQRVLAMGEIWDVDMSDTEITIFLQSTCSRILVPSLATNTTDLDTNRIDEIEPQLDVNVKEKIEQMPGLPGNDFPFERDYSSPAEAVVSLVREKLSFHASPFMWSICIESFCVHLADADAERVAKDKIPTVLCLYGFKLHVYQRSPIFSKTNLDSGTFISKTPPSLLNLDALANYRQCQSLSLEVKSATWTPNELTAEHAEIPTFMDGSLVGMFYRVSPCKIRARQFSFERGGLCNLHFSEPHPHYE